MSGQQQQQQQTPTTPPPISPTAVRVLPPRSPIGQGRVLRPHTSGVAGAKLASPEDKAVNNVTPDQAKILEENFKQYKNMDELSLEIVAAEAGLSPQDTARWFQHRRALWRQNEGLNPNSRSLADIE